MRNVLADLCLESEATTALAMRLARAYDEAHADADAGEDSSDAQLFKRLATAVGKYWSCKRAPNHAFESLECLGGSGYVEESGMPRLYREAPLASIWEGSGNVMSLDVLRALTRSPRSLEVFFDEVELAARRRRPPRRPRASLKGEFADPQTLESRARRVVEGMALCLQGSLLVRHAPPPSPTRSAPRGWAETAAWSTARCPAAATSSAIIARSLPRSLSAPPRSVGAATPGLPSGYMRPRPNLQLARVFGIRIGVSISWFVVLFFLICYLSDYFHEVLGGSQTTAYAIAVAGALGYFVSLILHELGHALMARRLGIPIVGIDLWFLGGLSQMGREPATPGEEFKVAAAGPAVTLVLFLLCLLRPERWSSADTGSPKSRSPSEGFITTPGLALIGWLGLVNAVLFVFNIIPAFPLDGGRIARAAIWRRTGDRNRATQWTGRTGQALALAVGLLGLWSFASSGSQRRSADDAARPSSSTRPPAAPSCRALSAGASSTSGSPTSWTASR